MTRVNGLSALLIEVVTATAVAGTTLAFTADARETDRGAKPAESGWVAEPGLREPGYVLELRDLMHDIKDITFRPIEGGARWLVGGELTSPQDFKRAQAILGEEPYRSRVVNMVGLHPNGMQVLAESIQKELNRASIRVRPVNGLIVLEGNVWSESDARQLLTFARGMVLDIGWRKADPILSRMIIGQPRQPWGWQAAGALVLVTFFSAVGWKVLKRRRSQRRFEQGFSSFIRFGKRAVTVPVSDGLSVSRQLVRPGERVDLLLTCDVPNEGRVSRLLAQDVFVFAAELDVVTLEVDLETAAQLAVFRDANAKFSIWLRSQADHGRVKLPGMTYDEERRMTG